MIPPFIKVLHDIIENINPNKSNPNRKIDGTAISINALFYFEVLYLNSDL